MNSSEKITEIMRLLDIYRQGCGTMSDASDPTSCSECTDDIVRRIANVSQGLSHDHGEEV